VVSILTFPWQEKFLLPLFINHKINTMAKKTTSPKAASAASKVLREGRTSKASKTAAGSALSQREKGGRKK
jgi:hypothetical protein